MSPLNYIRAMIAVSYYMYCIYHFSDLTVLKSCLSPYVPCTYEDLLAYHKSNQSENKSKNSC